MSYAVTDIVSHDNNQFEHYVLHAFATLSMVCSIKSLQHLNKYLIWTTRTTIAALAVAVTQFSFTLEVCDGSWCMGV